MFKDYVSHKRVKAVQIVGVWHPQFNPKRVDALFFDLCDPVFFGPYDQAMFARYVPVAGDYLVEYEDGYRSISPKKAFEDGYTLMPPPLPTHDPDGRPLVSGSVG